MEGIPNPNRPLTKFIHIVQRFAQDVVGPRVRDMDENEMMDPAVIKGLFETGVRFMMFYLYASVLMLYFSAYGYRNQ